MSLKSLFTLNAILAAAFGAAFMLVPAQTLALYDVTLSPQGIPIAQLLGATLVGIGILAWITSGPGLGFTIGSLAALAAYGVGFFGIRPRVERMNALGQAIAAAGGPPTPEQAAELGRLEKEMHTVERWDVILLTLSLATMVTARYWHF